MMDRIHSQYAQRPKILGHRVVNQMFYIPGAVIFAYRIWLSFTL
jgi:hypothetical protein